MADFLEGFRKWVSENPTFLIYNAMLFFAVSGAILIAIRIFLMLKRWYLTSKIRRQSEDFKTASKYIREVKKPLNRFQRFILGQTGEALTIAEMVILVVGILAIGGLVGYIVWSLGIFDSQNPTIQMIVKIVYIGVFIMCLFFLRSAIRECRKKGRILPLLYWIFATAGCGGMVYIRLFG